MPHIYISYPWRAIDLEYAVYAGADTRLRHCMRWLRNGNDISALEVDADGMKLLV